VLRNVTGGKANVRHSAEFSIHGFRSTHGQRDSAQKTPWMRMPYFRDWRHPAGLCCIRGSLIRGRSHSGGRWTPAMTRHGVGKLQSTSGANYGLFIEVHLYVRPRRNSTIAGTENLPCPAKLCIREGEIYPLTVSGYIKRV
jgi:hypothetical protein